ncbi:MAG: flagellar basal body rod C-terminal domain-containing protein, partial [bacterium]
NGEIKIDGRDITVDLEGNISVDGKQVGSLKIVDFEKPYHLDKIGENYFVKNDETNTGKSTENTEVNQGYLELSNVNAVKSLTEMIEVLRAYESYQKAIQSMDEMTSKAINEVGKLV